MFIWGSRSKTHTEGEGEFYCPECQEYRLYDGYGACPLTVAYGKVMLAEFCYGGKVTPSLPFDPTKPSSLYWQMKSKLFPWLQWNVMFKGKEWSKPNHKAIEN